MGIGIEILRIAVFSFLLLLLARVAVSLVSNFAREWRPRGVSLVMVEGILTATDPPVKFLRARVPPLDLGGIRLDLSIMILMLLCTVTLNLLANALRLAGGV